MLLSFYEELHIKSSQTKHTTEEMGGKKTKVSWLHFATVSAYT
jgi:hypothetical protein